MGSTVLGSKRVGSKEIDEGQLAHELSSLVKNENPHARTYRRLYTACHPGTPDPVQKRQSRQGGDGVLQTATEAIF